MSDSLELPTAESAAPLAEHWTEASQPYVGAWNQLVSTTNWDKGRIIVQWRQALIDSGAGISEYADEAWATLVGGVTGQHVGRLRRVFQRFGSLHPKYAGLYWSHFQAALDWEDAEMWLEGAVQSRWSVSQMRHQRWETLGALSDDQPREEDVVASELDEDFEPAPRQEPIASSLSPEYSEITAGPTYEGPDFGDEGAPADDHGEAHGEAACGEDEDRDTATATAPPVRPFADLADLPEDVVDAVENFKLVILKHRREGWANVACADLVASLEALKQLALAPPNEGDGVA
jgi:hypothetical protein